MLVFTANFTSLLTIFGGIILLLSLCCLFTSVYKRLIRSRRRGKRRHLFTPQNEMINMEWQLQQQLATMSQAPMPLPLALTVSNKDQEGVHFEADLEMIAPAPLKSVRVASNFCPNSAAEEERRIPTPASSVYSIIGHRPASQLSMQETAKRKEPDSIATPLQSDNSSIPQRKSIVQESLPVRIGPPAQILPSMSLAETAVSRSPFLPVRLSPKILDSSPSPSLSAPSPMVDRALSCCHSSASEANLSSSGLTHAPLPCRLSPILSLDGNWNKNRAPWEAQLEKEHANPEASLAHPESSPRQVAATTKSNVVFALRTPTPSSGLGIAESMANSAALSHAENLAKPSDMLIIKPFEVIII